MIDNLKSGMEMSFGDKIFAGFEVAFFAMAIVFCVLILLMIIIKLMGNIVIKNEKKVQQKMAESQPQVSATQTVQPTIVESAVDESEIIAAIVAAISSMSEGSDCKIVIRNITGVNESWSNAGLVNQLNSRL